MATSRGEVDFPCKSRASYKDIFLPDMHLNSAQACIQMDRSVIDNTIMKIWAIQDEAKLYALQEVNMTMSRC